MAAIFLSYRRTDSPQACRVYDWLTRRFGNDAVFMDVADIPFATKYTDYIKQSIASSRVFVALIGTRWEEKIGRADDPVRMEIETALEHEVPVLPVLIGTTPMPDADRLPPSIAAIAYQNASTVGVSRDFDTHMLALVPKVELILGSLSLESVVTQDPAIVERASDLIVDFLRTTYVPAGNYPYAPQWLVVNASGFHQAELNESVTLYVHRVSRVAETVELHFVLSFWSRNVSVEHFLAGSVMRHFERNPMIDDGFIANYIGPVAWTLKVRRSDEDPRQIWKMMTDRPLQLSLAFVATVSPRTMPE